MTERDINAAAVATAPRIRAKGVWTAPTLSLSHFECNECGGRKLRQAKLACSAHYHKPRWLV